jgi:hypothetical protein
MNEIICPHCKKAFKVDETSFADIVKQVRDHEFESALHEQVGSAVKIARLETESSLKDSAVQKDIEISKLQGQLKEKGDEVKLVEAQMKNSLQDDLSKKDSELADLRAKLNSKETEKELAVTKAVQVAEQERDELKIKLSSEELDKQRAISSLKDKYETQIKDRDDSIERLKDLKAKMSVKLVGETLEQHCQNEFNNVRTGQFPFAYFEKDNEAIKDDDEKKATKGDYVYRDYESKDGIEIISIMFEMKDEQDTSENKRTVESHLKKLDADRIKKNCEYAILVTLLEADNELYNRGIVDLSYKYEKMYVIRPQFFLPLISLLKNANLKSAEDKRQLVMAKNSNIDIENFVDEMESWKGGFLKNMKNAGSKHVEGIEQINKAIKDLERARDALMMSDKHLLTAETKIDDLTVKRLTKNAPSVAARFEELEK